MKVEITILVGLIGLAASIASFFSGRKSAARDDGKEQGEVLTRLDSIDEKVGKIDTSLESLNKQLGEQRDRITRIETKMEIYHGGGKE